MIDYIDIALFSDLLVVGTAGLIGGVMLPFAFRLIAYLVEIVRVIVE